MRHLPAGLHLDVADAVTLEPAVRAASRLLHAVELRRFADHLATLVAANTVTDVAAPSPTEDGSSTMTTMDLAHRLGRSPRTVRRWAQHGRLPARKDGGRWQIGA